MFGLRAGIVAAFAATSLVATSAFADVVDLGNLTQVSPVNYTKTFDLAYSGSFSDYYTFSIDTLSTVSGGVAEQDGFVRAFTGLITMVKDITVSSIGLAKYDTATKAYVSLAPADTSPASFSFGALAGGDYQLSINGTVQWGNFYTVGSTNNAGVASYTLSAGSSAAIASAAPEASDLVMAALGLAGVGFWARRQKKA